MTNYEHWPEARVLRRIRLGPQHRRMGPASHGQLPPPPAELVIARHDSFSRRTIDAPLHPYTNYYTFYLDEHREEVNDTCDQTLADALAWAANTFGIKPDEWTFIAEDVAADTPTPK